MQEVGYESVVMIIMDQIVMVCHIVVSLTSNATQSHLLIIMLGYYFILMILISLIK